MKTLYLLRHAKSSWNNLAISDHERPLNERGRTACEHLAAYIVRQKIVPAHVFCSSARRARETLELIAISQQTAWPETILASLYLAEADTIIRMIRQLDDTYPSLMVVGHNPGIGQALGKLIGDGPRELMVAAKTKVPTGALATLAFATPHWRTIAPGQGIIDDYVTPALLAKKH